jgi:flagellar biosynthesis activator protein FlaF
MARSPIDAYQSVQKDTMSGRELEAHVLMKAVAVLKACQDQWGQPGQFERLDEALRYNQRLWTLFQAELTDAENAMPKGLKQDLLNLSVFIDKRTFDTMAYPEKDKLTILIDINRNIAEGLSGNTA